MVSARRELTVDGVWQDQKNCPFGELPAWQALKGELKGEGEGEFGCARDKGKEGSIWRGVRNTEAA